MTETDTNDTDREAEAQIVKQAADNWDRIGQVVTVVILWLWAIRMAPTSNLLQTTEVAYLRFIAAVLTIIGITLLFMLVNQPGEGER